MLPFIVVIIFGRFEWMGICEGFCDNIWSFWVDRNLWRFLYCLFISVFSYEMLNYQRCWNRINLGFNLPPCSVCPKPRSGFPTSCRGLFCFHLLDMKCVCLFCWCLFPLVCLFSKRGFFWLTPMLFLDILKIDLSRISIINILMIMISTGTLYYQWQTGRYLIYMWQLYNICADYV